MKPFLAVMAVLTALVGYIPYFRDTVKGKTKPHTFSWFIWGLTALIAFGIQLSGNGGPGAFVNLAMGAGCFILAVYGLRDGIKYITRLDIVSLVMALIAIALWLCIRQPVVSILLVILIDVFSFIPTIMKSWTKPFEETLLPYAANSVKNVLAVFALTTISFATIAYPVYSAVSTLLFVVMLLVLRSKVLNKYE